MAIHVLKRARQRWVSSFRKKLPDRIDLASRLKSLAPAKAIRRRRSSRWAQSGFTTSLRAYWVAPNQFVYTQEDWLAPQFQKLDVEGGAGAVLRGAQILIKQLIELHGPEEREEVSELLTTFRYKAQTLSGSEVWDLQPAG